MNPNYHIHEQIDRYLKNNLSEEELVQFNKELLTNSELKTTLEAQKEAHELIVDNEMIKLRERMSRDLNNQGDSDSYNWSKTIIISAAISSVAVFSYIIYNNNQPTSNPTQETVHTQTEVITPTTEKEKISIKKNSTHNTSTNSSAIVEKNNTTNNEQTIISENNSGNENIIANDNRQTNTLPVVIENPTTNNNAVKNPVQEHVNIINCETTVITADVKVNYGYDNQEDATIIIDKLSVKGGTSPYLFSLNQGTFNTDNSFESIKNGNYHVHIKDKNGCVSEIKKEIIVKIPQKEIDDAFNPSMDETWKFPLKINGDATISILNKAGLIVYSASINGGYPGEWNGRDNNGNELNAGNYYFVLNYTNNNEVVKGRISIIK